jgi:hypothetical protein
MSGGTCSAADAISGTQPEHGMPALPLPAVAAIERALLRAERRAVHTMLSHPGPAIGREPWPQGVLHDHRLEVFGDISDALDALLPGTDAGWRLMRIAYPEIALAKSEEAVDWDISSSRNLSALLDLLEGDDARPADPPSPDWAAA